MQGNQVSGDKPEPGVLGQYKILTSSPAPAHGGGTATAFWAQQKNAGHAASDAPALIAMVGNRASLFRTNIIDRYKVLTNAYLMRLMEWGVFEGPDEEQLLAMIFQRPAGASLHESFIANGKGMSDGDVISKILPPLVKGLKELADHRITHGAVRPANIYMGPTGAVVLGECLSAPGAFDQPISCLTIERGLTSPIGRGAGMVSDDIYALGATLVCLATGVDPLADMDPQDAVLVKIERGSLAALLGRNHLGGSLMELARGMLDDNPQHRWSIEIIEQWINGRRTTSPQTLAGRQAPRPFMIMGTEHWDPRSIADAFSRNVPEAMRLISNDELIKWVKRTLRDSNLAERIADAVNMPMMTGKLGSHDARLVARVAMALDPAGPIRYQGQSLMPDAFGTVLARIIIAGESPQPLAELIIAQLPLYWYNIQADFHEDHVAPIKLFEHARLMLEQTAIGAGIERCHYELSPTSAYVAEGFEKLLIFDSRQFIVALEHLAGSPKRPAQPVTRQAAAFLATRDEKLGNRVFNRLVKARSEAEKALGNLEILTEVQKHHDDLKLPHLCQWFETLLQPAIERLHNRKSREAMKTDIHKAANTGSLPIMLAAIENPVIYHWDRQGLAEARREFAILDMEKNGLLQELQPGSHVHRSVGREAATIVAGILSVVMMVSMVALQIGQGL